MHNFKKMLLILIATPGFVNGMGKQNVLEKSKFEEDICLSLNSNSLQRSVESLRSTYLKKKLSNGMKVEKITSSANEDVRQVGDGAAVPFSNYVHSQKYIGVYCSKPEWRLGSISFLTSYWFDKYKDMAMTERGGGADRNVGGVSGVEISYLYSRPNRAFWYTAAALTGLAYGAYRLFGKK